MSAIGRHSQYKDTLTPGKQIEVGMKKIRWAHLHFYPQCLVESTKNSQLQGPTDAADPRSHHVAHGTIWVGAHTRPIQGPYRRSLRSTSEGPRFHGDVMYKARIDNAETLSFTTMLSTLHTVYGSNSFISLLVTLIVIALY